MQGKILIANCQYVIAAFCTGCPHDADPYEALRTTLSMTEGTFAFLALSEKEAANFDHSLYIAIERLMDSLTKMPVESNELFDEKGLLDRIFGNKANLLKQEENNDPQQDSGELDFNAAPEKSSEQEPAIGPFAQAKSRQDAAVAGIEPLIPQSRQEAFASVVAGENRSAEEIAFTDLAFNRTTATGQCLRRSAEYPVPKIEGQAPQAAPIASFKMLEPFIDSAQAISGVGTISPGFSQTAAEQRISLGRLRSLPSHANGKFSWQRLWYELRALQWLPLFLLLVGLASFIAPQIWPTGGNDGLFRQEKVRAAATPAAQVH